MIKLRLPLVLTLLVSCAMVSCAAEGPSRRERDASARNPLLPRPEDEPPITRESIFRKHGFRMKVKSDLPLEEVAQWWMGQDSILAMTQNPDQRKELRLYSIDRNTGVVKWMEHIEDPIVHFPVETDDHVYYVTNDTLFNIERSFHPYTKKEYGKLMWRLPLEHIAQYRLPTTIRTSIRSVNKLNTLELWAVDDHGRFAGKHTRFQTSGDYDDSKWIQGLKPTLAWFSASSPIGASDNRVFLGSFDYRFYGVDTMRKDRAWLFKTGGESTVAPIVAGELVYFSSEDGSVVCAQTRNGQEQWRFHCERPSGMEILTKDIGPMARTHDWALTPPLSLINHMAIGRDHIYIGSTDFNLYCLNRMSGKVEAVHRQGCPIEVAPWVKDRDKHTSYKKGPDVYYLNKRGEFHAMRLAQTVEQGAIHVDDRHGKKITHFVLKPMWQLPGGERVVCWGKTKNSEIPPNLYVMKKGNVLAAVNELTGDVRWEYPMHHFSHVLPTPQGEPILYMGTKDGWFYALIEEYEHNRILWQEFVEDDKLKVEAGKRGDDFKKLEDIMGRVKMTGLPPKHEE